MLVCRKDGSLFGNKEESEDESCSAESGDGSEIEDGRDSAAETKQVEEVEPSRGGHWTSVPPRRLGGQKVSIVQSNKRHRIKETISTLPLFTIAFLLLLTLLLLMSNGQCSAKIRPNSK